MPADVFNYDDLDDLRYNPFTRKYNPKIIGYDSSDPEERTIPSTSPFIIKLFHSPLQSVPSKMRITLKSTGEILKEVALGTPPANKQYAVCYDELGNGQILFNAGQAGQVVYINYYSLGTLHQRSTLKFSIFGGSTTKIVASSNSSTGSQTIANEIILTSENAATKLNDIIDELDALGGGEIKLLEGTFNITSFKVLFKENIIISGSGYNTIINCSTTTPFDMSGIENLWVRDCYIKYVSSVATFFYDSGVTYSKNRRFDNIKLLAGDALGNYATNGFTYGQANNCIVIGNSGGATSALVSFYECHNSTGCFAKYFRKAFDNCNNISGCTGENQKAPANFATFSGCKNISACYANTGTGNGFYSCRDVAGCEAAGFSTDGFNLCKNVSACFANNNLTSGFQSCENVSNSEANGNVNGFKDCKPIGCNYSHANTGSNYNNCFADRAGTQAAQDTSAGGYNG